VDLSESWVWTPPSNLASYGPQWNAATLGQVEPPPAAPQLARLMNAQPVARRDALEPWVLRVVGAGVLGYHGWRRGRGSWPWALGWAAVGAVAPVLGGLVAAFQGFGSRPERED
jgi:hypothetical protein